MLGLFIASSRTWSEKRTAFTSSHAFSNKLYKHPKNANYQPIHTVLSALKALPISARDYIDQSTCTNTSLINLKSFVTEVCYWILISWLVYGASSMQRMKLSAALGVWSSKYLHNLQLASLLRFMAAWPDPLQLRTIPYGSMSVRSRISQTSASKPWTLISIWYLYTNLSTPLNPSHDCLALSPPEYPKLCSALFLENVVVPLFRSAYKKLMC
jgi:hypothetical protein